LRTISYHPERGALTEIHQITGARRRYCVRCDIGVYMGLAGPTVWGGKPVQPRSLRLVTASIASWIRRI
jgi:hypothetical protein